MFKLIARLNQALSLNTIFRSSNTKYIPLIKFNTQISNSAIRMPPKRANNKRKVTESSPVVKTDPFTAAKKVKKVEETIVDDLKIVTSDVDPQPSLEKTNSVENDIVTEKEENLAAKQETEKLNGTSKLQPKINSHFTVLEKKETNNKKNNKKAKKNKDDEEDDEEGGDENEKPKETPKYNAEDFKKPSNGKEYNLKMVTFNVNGIRACIEHGLMEYIKAEDADIVCVQETKCDKTKIPTSAELPNYHSYWLSGDTQGYSGVGLYTKMKPIKVTYELDSKKHNNEGRVIIAEYEKFILVNSYIPNSARGLVRLPFRMGWEVEFRQKLAELEKIKPIIWCGDLNVAHNEIDLYNPEKSKKSAGFTKEERECFTNLLSDGYFDSYRHLYPDAKDVYTWWSYMRNARQKNQGWRIDYFVLSNKLKEYLVDNVIRAQVYGSDHCPVVLYLKI